MSVAPSDLRASRRVGTMLGGKYRIERLLGTGGMASVYAAAHRNGHRVAIKVLHEASSHRGDTRARFLREGYVANLVGHAGAVRVLDDDVAEDGSAFLVMELLRGETLRARCARSGGRLAHREVLALGWRLLDVLGAAHAAGIIHRDIKPENLFLTTEGVLKVLDFGIARIEDDPGALATVTGTRLGTPAFMPPELALGRTSEIDARTDVWSAGATLFQLLSGEVVHEGPGAAEMVVRAATVPARSLCAAAPGVPAPIVALVDRALAFARVDRWPSARAMQEAIEGAYVELHGQPIASFSFDAVPDANGSNESLSVIDTVTGRPPMRARAAPDDPTVPSPSSDASPGGADGAGAADAGEADAGAPPKNADAGVRNVEATRTSPGAADPPRRAGGRWRTAAIAAAIVALACALLVSMRRGSTPESAPEAAAASVGPTAVAPRGCTTNRDCTAANGEPSVCRREDGACVALGSVDCRVISEPDDIANDATVWLGAMWPAGEADPAHYGPRSVKALSLARRDFAETSGGLPPARPGGPKRPIGVVLCDDRDNAQRAADHLVNDLHVSAIIGFRTSKEVLDLASSHFLPKRVLAIVATGSATALRDIPRNPGEPRLVWRVTPATDMASRPFAAVVEQIEAELRKTPGLLRPGEAVRVAQLRQESLAGQSTVDSRMATLRFNGKSVAENGDSFRLVARAESFSANDAAALAAHERTARDVAAFRPHVVLDMPPIHTLLAAVERNWPASAPFRPRYLTEGTWADLGPASFDWSRAGLHRRLFSVDQVSSGAALVRFAFRYNELFTPRVTPATSPSSPYDAFYLFAYAAAALGEEPPSGLALARAMARLLPPGEPIDVGPSGIYPAFLALSAGKHLDLQGAASSLDLDPVTGDTTLDWAVYCLSPASGAEPARQMESGLIWESRTGMLRGTLRCP